MKKYILHLTLSIAASLILSTGLLAQEQVDVSIKVKKDGKVIKDTTYQFDDALEAKHAIKMMEAHSGSGHSKAMVFISEDGETTEIKEFHGESLTWVSEGDSPHKHGKKVIVMKSDDGSTFDILLDEDSEEGDIVKKKEIKVMVSSDEEGNWTVVEGDKKMMDEDENVFIIKGDDDVKVNVMKIIEEEGDGENVKVIVIKESGDIHKDHDVDHDEDSDHDEDVEVEVKVIKKEKKQKK